MTAREEARDVSIQEKAKWKCGRRHNFDVVFDV